MGSFEVRAYKEYDDKTIEQQTVFVLLQKNVKIAVWKLTCFVLLVSNSTQNQF